MKNIICYEFENFRLDVVNEQLLKNNKPVPLTHKAFKTLLILVQNYGQLVKKEDIINEIWRDSFVEDANLTQNIYILRKTLGNNKYGKPFIETVPKRGYCFVGDIQKIKSSDIPVVESAYQSQLLSDDAILDEQFIFVKEDNPSYKTKGYQLKDLQKIISPNNKKSKKSFLALAVLAVFLISFLGFGILLYQDSKTASEFSVKSIAVLPFRTIGAESSNAKMGFGMADSVITNLSKQQKIPVRPSSAIFQLAERDFDSVDIGKKLEVDSVLEGTIQQDGELVRISVRLIKISDGSTIWAETFDEKFTNIFALQDSISTKVAKELAFNLSANQEEQLIARNTSNTEAYQAYQLGIYFWNKRTKDDLEKAVSYFQKATQLDPNYALAYAMLADSYDMIHYYGFAENRKEAIDKADEAAKKALSLNDSIPQAHIAISYVQIAKYNDPKSGVASLERAIFLSPYNATARLRYGWQLLILGNIDGSLEQMRIAQANDPLSPISNSALCSLLLLKKEFAEAVKYSEKAVELKIDVPLIRIQLANAYFLNGQIDKAISVLQTEINHPKYKGSAFASLGYIYAKTGKTKEAEEIYSRLKNDKEIECRYSDLILLAYALGHKKEALADLKSMLAKYKRISLSMTADPYWEEILQDDDFKKLISTT